MEDFAYHRPATVDEAIALVRRPRSAFVAGGTNLIDLMKGGVEAPVALVDVTRLPLGAIDPLPGGGLRIGATVRNSDLANDPAVRAGWPLLSQALLAGASPQLRNMATVGGNLMQRTRCHYFVDVAFDACNKRRPGSGCAAQGGINRIHAIVGASPGCVAVAPSDMNVALAALRATVVVRGLSGERRIPIDAFHRLPGDAPERDTTLRDGELIVAVELPPATAFAAASHYLKVRDRASYAFALVSVAAALDVQGGVVRDAALALGGVAHKPWRVAAAEGALVGRRPDAAAATAAADLLLADAVPLRHNAFKVELARRSVVRAVRTAAGNA